jgi:hypothetical protein
MATYLVTYRLPAASRNEAISRFINNEAAMTPPDGVVSVGRWHTVTGKNGRYIVEADDPVGLADWVLHWTDIMTYEITPVVSDEELGGLFGKHGMS